MPPMNTDQTLSTEYVPSRSHQISGTSLRHDPNVASSTIENLDDDDEDDEDDDDVYDPTKPTVFQQMRPPTSETAPMDTSNAVPTAASPKRTEGKNY